MSMDVAGMANPLAGTTPGLSPRDLRTGPGGTRPGKEAVVEQARRFETALVQMLVKELREGGLEEGFFGKGAGSDTYGWLLDTHLSDALAERMPLGLAQTLADQLYGDRGTQVLEDGADKRMVREVS